MTNTFDFDYKDEKSDTQLFWLRILRDVLGCERPEELIEFEKRVDLFHVSFIDAYIPSTGIVIEQKSSNVNLDLPAKQSDGTSLTPFEQAKRYYDWLPASKKGRYIITCNFREMRIYDMETPKAEPRIIMIENIESEKDNLSFMITPKRKLSHEVELSIRAGELAGKLYDSLITRYVNPDDKESLRSLNIFCVRIVFLLYAEDSGMLAKFQFHDYIKSGERFARNALRDLFDVLNQKPEERDPYLNDDLKAFPYVDGGIFEEGNIEIPKLDGEPLRIIIEDMSEGFNWSDISPTIFGAVFESTLNPETRHSGGMHYTSIENIHKVIDPLFLDDLTKEAEDIINSPKSSGRTRKLRNFHTKLSNLTFFDPACGSGNFLTETYLSIRRLENRILAELSKQISFTDIKSDTPIKVSISQFYGIEVNDFAVAVARTALWIAESQMWNETKNLIQFYGDLLPLKSCNHIIEANALRTDWKEFLPDKGSIYIMGNPPFLGYSIQNEKQKEDILSLFTDEKGRAYTTAGKIDYIAGWYFKASEMVQDSRIKAAFVSTNSITQGEQVTYIFKTLYERFGININFAHQSFVWNSEASEKAHVHCVVIGFDTDYNSGKKRLYINEDLMKVVDNINFYLVSAPNVFAVPRTKAISKDAPPMITGNRAADGGNLIIEAKDYEDFIRREPRAKKYIKRYMMGYDFINNIKRYCLWLVEVSPYEIRSMPLVYKRVKACGEDRLKGAPDRQKLAETPHLFRETSLVKSYLAIPHTSSEVRKYIPMGFLDDSVVPGNGGLLIIPDATLYHFGILTSRVHMAWMRAVCGRLEMSYRYSQRVVYNNFVWPSPTQKQRARIESTAQMILDARALYPDDSFAALYDNVLMPKKLRKAHELNDKAVCEAYGWDKNISEEDIVSNLFELYQQNIDNGN